MTVTDHIERVLPRKRAARRLIGGFAVTAGMLAWLVAWWPGAVIVLALALLVVLA